MSNFNKKANSIEEKLKLLEDFSVPITNGILERLESLRGNDIALERYVKGIIKESLFKGED